MAEISLKIKSDFEQASADFKKLGSLSESTQKQLAKLQSQFADGSIDKFMQKNKLNAVAMTATKGATAGLTAELSGLQREMARLINKGLDPMDPALNKMKARMTELQGQIKPASGGIMSFATAFQSAGAVLAGSAVAYKLYDIAKASIKAYSEMEQVSVAFEVMLGSAEEAQSLLDQITAFAAKTPFEKTELIGYAKSMIGVGMAVKDVIPTMEMLGNIAAGVGMEKLPNIVLAFNKMQAKGKASLEELWPMVEAGVPILDQLTKDLGKSKDEVIKMASAGKLSFQQVQESLKKVEAEKFAGLMDKLSKTLGGRFSNFNDNLNEMGVIIGGKIAPSLGIMLDAANKAIGIITSLFGKSKKSGEDTATTFSKINGYITTIISPLKLLWEYSMKVLEIFANWDKIWVGMKSSFVEGIQVIKIKMLELGVTIIDYVLGSVQKLLGYLQKIPGTGDYFKNVSAKVDGYRDSIQKTLAAEKSRYESMKKEHAEELKRMDKTDKIATKSLDKEVALQNQKAELGKQNQKIFTDQLKAMSDAESLSYQNRLKTTQDFFAQKMESEQLYGEALLLWQEQQTALIAENTKMTFEEKILAMDGLSKAVKDRSSKDLKNAVQFGAQIASYGEQMFSDLATTMENAGVKSKAFAVGMKIMSAAQAGINSYLAFTQVLADATIWPSWLRLPLAGTILAAGLAKQAAIWSTPLAETGISDYTVPEIRANKNDSFGVMAQAGEKVSVTPRGEDSSGMAQYNIYLNESVIFSTINKGIKTGQININNKNVGRGVFAN